MGCRLALVGLCVLLVTGCGRALQPPDLGGIYDAAAMHHDEWTNPVIVIPGILGSRVKDMDSGRLIWGAFEGDYANPERTDGARLVALPMAEGQTLADLRDGGVSDGSLDRLRVRVFGLPIELSAYAQILGTLGVGGYRDLQLGQSGAIDYGDDHYTCFQFDYDWRRDNVENAQRLHQFIIEKRAYVQQEIARRYGRENADVKFDIVAHSMGGLVTRYFLRYGDAELPEDGPVPAPTWAGAQYVDRAILVGTPNAGSAYAVDQLVNGVHFAPGLPRYEPAILGTMPAIYQLLGRPRHGGVVEASDPSRRLDTLDPETWIERKWGLADPRQDRVLQRLLPDVPDAADRRAIAEDHLRKCLHRAERFFEALDRPDTPPDGTDLYLIAGDAVKTDAVLAVDDRGRVRTIERGPGDGTVLRTSAVMDERVGGVWQARVRTPIAWRQVTFLFADHLGLTKDPTFTDNVLYLLLESPRMGSVMGPAEHDASGVADEG